LCFNTINPFGCDLRKQTSINVYLKSFSYAKLKSGNQTNMFSEISHSSLFVSDFLGSMYKKKAVFTMMIAQEKVTEAAAQRKA